MAPGIPDPELNLDLVLHQVPVAVTVLDLEGKILFYNRHAPRILDRQPHYLGRDIRGFHHPKSAAKIEKFLESYARGGREEFCYQIEREGNRLAVRVAPLLEGERCRGLIHTVMLLGAVSPGRPE